MKSHVVFFKVCGRQIIFLILLSVIILFSGSFAAAETYYVSPSGQSSWPTCTDSSLPCSIEDAMKNAVAGDIVLFRGGTYLAGEKATPYHAWFEPANSGTSGSPITFKAYPEEQPIILGDFNSRVNDFVIGTGSSNYIIWDGFTVTATNNNVAGIMMGGDFDESSFRYGLELRNITAVAGTNNVIHTDNADIVRMEGVGSGVIRGCRFGNLHTSSWSDNNAALKSYHNANVIIENNEFFDSPNGISCKSTTNDMTIRNNYFHGNTQGFFMGVYGGQPNDNNKIYNNLFVNNSDLGVFIRTDGMDGAHADNWEFYNNTIHNNGNGINFGHCRNLILYNNIISTKYNNNITTVRDTTILESDHNQFGADRFYFQLGVYSENSTTFNSLSSWKSSGYLINGQNPGVGSLASDPGFLNASGKLSLVSDFILSESSSCRESGRNGTNIGADASTVGPAGEGGSMVDPPGNLLLESIVVD